jgi:hypothetical protein
LTRVSLSRTFSPRVPRMVNKTVVEPFRRSTSGGLPEAMLTSSTQPGYVSTAAEPSILAGGSCHALVPWDSRSSSNCSNVSPNPLVAWEAMAASSASFDG